MIYFYYFCKCIFFWKEMKIGLKAYVIQDIGQRSNQEDSFYPPFIQPCHFEMTEREESYYEGTAHTDDELFLVCDGMGGHERGEVASRIACDEISRYIVNEEKEGREFSDKTVCDAVDVALKALDEAEDPETKKKMGTTLTLLKVQKNSATIAHVGDSRVYHFRPATKHKKARILFRTDDHNLANMLIKSGSMTFQQMRNFSQKHVLTRALQAHLARKPKIDIYHTKDIKPGDVFFLCSDGILEELYDEDLCSMLTNTDYTDEQRLQILLTFCEGNKDNHTAWLVRVNSCDSSVYQPVKKVIKEVVPTGIINRIMSWLRSSK